MVSLYVIRVVFRTPAAEIRPTPHTTRTYI